MRSTTILKYLSVLLLFTFACEQSIDIEIPLQEEKIVVYAMLNNVSVPYVMITKTINVYEYSNQNNFNLKPIDNAKIKIWNEEDTLEMNDPVFNEDGVAVFYFPGVFQIEADQHFFFEAEVDGKMVDADAICPREIIDFEVRVEIDTIEYDDGPYIETYLVAEIKSELDNKTGVQLEFEMEYLEYIEEYDYENEVWLYDSSEVILRSTGYVSDNVSEFGKDFNEVRQYISIPEYYRHNENISIHDFPAVEFKITGTVNSYNTEALNYFETVNRQFETINNPFAEPTLVDGNINGGLGVFGASIWNENTFEVSFICCE